jgi:uncharacterized protein YndB with AHSA1/START domain
VNNTGGSESDALIVRLTIGASRERLFDAWTTPAQLMEWWGPVGVSCTAAEVDLRVGGRYRIANRLPDGETLWITGEFERIERPNLLVYSWRLETGAEAGTAAERVSVRFRPQGDLTEVVVTHERIATQAMKEQHEQGWVGCLAGLKRYMSTSVRRIES